MEISEKRLKELELAKRKLDALEAGGVDNWEWYDEAMSSFVEEDDEPVNIDSTSKIEELKLKIKNAIKEVTDTTSYLNEEWENKLTTKILSVVGKD